MPTHYRGGVRINYAKCIGCKTCYEICPADVFRFEENSKMLTVVYPEECWFCGACIYDCPSEGALTMELPLACL
jgi:NAD-dependent dihydropyrimidine dehydrogenase PreA subunit